MNNKNKFTILIRFAILVLAIVSVVRVSHSQNWISQTSGTTNTLHAVCFLDNLKGFTVQPIAVQHGWQLQGLPMRTCMT